MRTIVYYGVDGEAALKRVAHLRAEHGNDSAQPIAAEAFVGERIKADEIEFMPDVKGWHRARIEVAFSEQKERDRVDAEREAARRASTAPLKEYDEDSFRRAMTSRPTGQPARPQAAEPEPLARTVTPHSMEHGVYETPVPSAHRVAKDGSKFVVKLGDSVVGGPFDKKADAKAFADDANAGK